MKYFRPLGAAASAAGKVAAKGLATAGKVGAKMGSAAAKGAGKVAAKGVKAGVQPCQESRTKHGKGCHEKSTAGRTKGRRHGRTNFIKARN